MRTRFRHAIVRRPGADLGRGLTTSTAEPPTVEVARAQHQRYVDALTHLGLEVLVLEPLPRFPDAYFVEDVAVVTEEVAVITRPGAAERRGEELAIGPVLETFRPVVRIEAPATLEGGDVLMLGDLYLIGVSDRTSEEGAAQLGAILAAHGKRSQAIAVGSGLHLKSSVNPIGDDVLLVTSEYADRPELAHFRKIVVATGEEAAANSLWVNDTILTPTGFPATRRKLEATGQPVVELDVGAARTMDGGLSCMSLRF